MANSRDAGAMIRFSQLVEKLRATNPQDCLECFSGSDPEITGLAAIDQASPNTLSFVEGHSFYRWVKHTQASALILPSSPDLQSQATERDIAWLATPQPRLLFARIIALFYQPHQPAPEIHPSAVIHPAAQIGNGVFIGPHVAIEAGVEIGDNVCIYPNVVVYPEVSVGDRTILHANCTLHERTQIGRDCVIHSGAVIGAEGFGFVPTPSGWFKMQQSGRTVLEDRVEIGCNTTIDRPAVGETRIAQDTKIDNLVQIGHGCQIGAHCALAGQVGLAGGVHLGNHVILAGQVGIANQARLGDGVIVSAQAGITSNVKPGAVMSGAPALPHKTWLRVATLYSRLPEMYHTLKQLQHRLEDKA